MCLPKSRGTKIVEGSIFDEAVVASMLNYHETASAWLAIQQKVSKHPELFFTEERVTLLGDHMLPRPATFQPSFHASPKLDITFLVGEAYASNILYVSTARRILSIKTSNVSAHNRENPELIMKDTPKPVASAPLGLDRRDDDTLISDPAVIDKKYRGAMAGKMLLLARVQDGDANVVLPQFRDDFISVLQEPTKEVLVRLYRSGVTDFAHDCQQESRDYFTRMIRLGIWNNCTVNLWIQDYLHDKPLDESPHLLK